MTTLHFGRYRVETSREQKMFFGDAGITKGALIEYYRNMAMVMLPFTKDRPLMMERFPDGIRGRGFYQKEIPDSFPKWLHRVTVDKKGGTVTHVVCDNAATLVYLADQACLTFHLWLSRRDRLHYPDWMIFDLDPGDKDFAGVRRAAFVLRELLLELGLEPFVMTTGSTGLHVVAPLLRKTRFAVVRATAREIAAMAIRRHPDELTMEQEVKQRKGRLFIDTNRNAYAQTAVAPYSVRPHPSAPVAAPLHWYELEDASLHSQSFSLANMEQRINATDDPWASLRHCRRSLKKIAERLAVASP